MSATGSPVAATSWILSALQAGSAIGPLWPATVAEPAVKAAVPKLESGKTVQPFGLNVLQTDGASAIQSAELRSGRSTVAWVE